MWTIKQRYRWPCGSMAMVAAVAALAGCAEAPGSEPLPHHEPLPRYELPDGWEWQTMHGVTDQLTAIKYLGERPSEETRCDCQMAAELIEISGTPQGSEEEARQETLSSYESGKEACDNERQHRPEVGDCGLLYQELTIAGHDVYVYLAEGMDGPVSLFTFLKEDKVVHGSVSGRADEHLPELETVIGTLTWE